MRKKVLIIVGILEICIEGFFHRDFFFFFLVIAPIFSVMSLETLVGESFQPYAY